MPRLPQPGGDAGNWGQILNDYLSVEYAADGTPKNTFRPASCWQDRQVLPSRFLE